MVHPAFFSVQSKEILTTGKPYHLTFQGNYLRLVAVTVILNFLCLPRRNTMTFVTMFQSNISLKVSCLNF